MTIDKLHTVTAEHWEHFEHGADIGVRGIGPTPGAAFEQAALAMTAAVTDPASVDTAAEVSVECSAPDEELLLVDWLNAIIYEMATRRMLFSRYEVTVENGSLQGRAWGEPVDILKHRPSVEVKGATYTSLRVQRDADGRWIAQCVIDV